jgi:hypothetical protein
MAAAMLTILIFAAAVLYSSVGHAGASGYLAAMALFGVGPAVMKPTALTLNILVATIATVKFHRAGHFSFSLFAPFAIASVPFALFGGATTISAHAYKRVVGAVLLYSAFRLFRASTAAQPVTGRPPLWVALVVGAAIGYLSGLVGVGGGIFLSPLLLLMGWAQTRETAAVSAAFILVNSVAGLLGQLMTAGAGSLPAPLPVWAAAAGTGGWIGASYGSRQLATPTIRRLLAVVLVIAALKMLAA